MALRTSPTIDLGTLAPFTSFPNDMHQAIQSATTRALASDTFEHQCLDKVNHYEGRGRDPCPRNSRITSSSRTGGGDVWAKGRFVLSGGNVATVGDPDFSWAVSSAQPNPKVIVCISLHVYSLPNR